MMVNSEEDKEEIDVDKYRHQKDTFAMWELLSDRARELIMMAPMNKELKEDK